MPVRAVEVKGLNELRAAIRTTGDAGLKKSLAAANKTGADVVAKRAGPLVPVRSGRLRKSVRALGSQRSGRVRAGNAGVAYAAAIHWGRKRGNVGSPPGNHPGPNPIQGRPFLIEAAQRSIAQVRSTYARAIEELVARINTKG